MVPILLIQLSYDVVFFGRPRMLPSLQDATDTNIPLIQSHLDTSSQVSENGIHVARKILAQVELLVKLNVPP